VVAATPTVGLVLSTEVGRSGAITATTHLDALEQEAIGAKFAVRRLEATCKGSRDCLLTAAREASVPVVLSVSIAWSKKQATIDLEGVRVSDGATVAQLTFGVQQRMGETERARVQPFFAQLAAAATVSDAPKRVEAKLTPEVKDTPPLVASTGRTRVPELVAGGGAVAAGVLAGVLVGVASADRAKLENTPELSPLTRAEAETLRAQANGGYTGALISGLTAAALAALAIVLALRD
jgi:hypothetical protein